VVHLQRSSATNFLFGGRPPDWPFGALAIMLGLVLCWIVLMQCWSLGKRVQIALGRTVLLAILGFSLSQTIARGQTSQGSSSAPSRVVAQQTANKLDQMIASDASPKELAQYLFETHGCKSCHTIGHNSKLNFTAKGKGRAQGFEGCIRMLAAMTVVVQLPENKRSSQQRQEAAHFDEFGCTACHKLTPGKLGLTEVGAKLAHLHLGCVEIERLTSTRTAAQR
jgi:hypothetical protein